MHFGENQLSPSLFGLSPLSTGHPPSFQPWWVRPSTRSYPRFSLPMDRSLGFGSTARDWTPRPDSGSPALPDASPALPPPHGDATRLRVYRPRLNALFRLAFAPAPPLGLTSPRTVTRRLILQKARHHGPSDRRPTTTL